MCVAYKLPLAYSIDLSHARRDKGQVDYVNMNSHSLFIRYILKVCLILPPSGTGTGTGTGTIRHMHPRCQKRSGSAVVGGTNPVYTETVGDYILPVQSYSLHPYGGRTFDTKTSQFDVRYRLLLWTVRLDATVPVTG
jgi:hypothetical protein